ncbi:MAG TPA: hypothetical protein VFX98_16520 [Longimicrobiaceae bacterium]|nr:hypothetical protein [Longimicrobiaceae bacterium]
MQKSTRIALLALAALALPVGAAAQDAPQPAAPASPVQAEITQIQQRLGALQQQAVQDSAVQAAQAAFEAALFAAMERLDPTVKEKTARGEALQQEVAAARQASDNAKLNALATEAQQLQAFFTGVQRRALATPEIQEARKAFLSVLLARMTQIDPEAEKLVARLEELRAAQAGTAQQ